MTFETEPTEDEAMGMAWWNGLTDRARALWLERVGTVAADAWALFKSDPSVAFEIGLQEGQELARANIGGSPLRERTLSPYAVRTAPTRH